MPFDQRTPASRLPVREVDGALAVLDDRNGIAIGGIQGPWERVPVAVLARGCSQTGDLRRLGGPPSDHTLRQRWCPCQTTVTALAGDILGTALERTIENAAQEAKWVLKSQNGCVDTIPCHSIWDPRGTLRAMQPID